MFVVVLGGCEWSRSPVSRWLWRYRGRGWWWWWWCVFCGWFWVNFRKAKEPQNMPCTTWATVKTHFNRFKSVYVYISLSISVYFWDILCSSPHMVLPNGKSSHILSHKFESEHVLLLNHDCNIAPLIVFWQDDPAKIGLPIEGFSDGNTTLEGKMTKTLFKELVLF